MTETLLNTENWAIRQTVRFFSTMKFRLSAWSDLLAVLPICTDVFVYLLPIVLSLRYPSTSVSIISLNFIFLQDGGSNLEAFARNTFDDSLRWEVWIGFTITYITICSRKYLDISLYSLEIHIYLDDFRLENIMGFPVFLVIFLYVLFNDSWVLICSLFRA